MLREIFAGVAESELIPAESRGTSGGLHPLTGQPELLVPNNQPR